MLNLGTVIQIEHYFARCVRRDCLNLISITCPIDEDMERLFPVTSLLLLMKQTDNVVGVIIQQLNPMLRSLSFEPQFANCKSSHLPSICTPC